MDPRNRSAYLACVALALLGLGSPAVARAQESQPGARPALLESQFAADVAFALDTAREFQRNLRRGAEMSGPGSLAPAFDRLRAADLLITDRQRRVADRLIGAPAGIVARHGSMEALTRERMARLASDVNAILAAIDAADRQRVASTLDTFIEHLLAEQRGGVDRTPIGQALPAGYRPLALPQVSPALDAAIVPAYAQASPPAPVAADTASAADVPLNGAIGAKAQELGYNPIAIFEFVQNEVGTEFYHGAMKGAQQALVERSANAVDQSSLLVALLRASGVPARYVRGVIRLDDTQARDWTGADSMRGAADLLTRGGIPFTPVRAGGTISALTVEHTWVEAFVPYANYRGAPLDVAGRAWVPLDPSFTTLVAPAPQPLPSGFALNAGTLIDEYLAEPRVTAPFDFYVARLTGFLDANLPGTAVDPYLFKVTRRQVSAGLLSSTLPYQTVSVNGEYSELPASLRHTVRFTAEGDEAVSFDVTVPLSEILGRRLTLSYVPATVEDQIASDAFLGLDRTPAYLVKLRPVLKIGGAIRVAGETAIQMGNLHRMTMEMRTPRTTVPIANTYLAGGYYAVAFAASATRYEPAVTPAPDDTEHPAADLLAGIASDYHDEWNRGETSLAGLLHVLLVRPVASEVVVGSVYNRTLLFGAPQAIDWRGVFVDADFRSTEPVAPAGTEGRPRDFLRMSGLIGSMLENGVLERKLGVDAVSAAKLIQLANAEAIPVRRITAANLDAELPLLSTADAVRTHIADAVRRGWEAIVPQSDLVREAWSGIGYIVFDPSTGAGGYFISGGLSGGMTSLDPHAWVQQQYVSLLGSPYSGAPNTNPLAAFSIRKVTVTDHQEGVAGLALPRPIAVWVRDADGKPVQGASVTFSIVAGDGNFAGPASTIVLTDNLGVATATPTLGRSTATAPFYVKASAADKEVTRVGENIVSARVTATGGDIPLEVPFQLFAFPGPPAGILKVLGQGNTGLVGTAGGTVRASLVDQYLNPISNAVITLRALPPIPYVGGTWPAGATNLTMFPTGSCATPNPMIGDCNAQPSLTLETSVYGVSADTIFGDTDSTEYRVQASSAGVGNQVFGLFTTGDRDFSNPTFRGPGLGITQLQLVSDKGEAINATQVGTPLKRPLGSILVLIEDNYTVEPTGAACGPAVTDPDCYVVRSTQIARVHPVDVHRNGPPIQFPQKDNQVVDAPRNAEFGRVEFVVTGGATMNPPIASLPAHNPGGGRYQSFLTAGPTPERNAIAMRGSASVWIPYVSPKTGLTTPVLVPLHAGQYVSSFDVSLGAPTARLLGSPDVPVQNVFGVRATIPDKAYVLLGPGGASIANVDVGYTVEPASYAADQADVDLFAVKSPSDEWLGLLPGTTPQGAGHARIHRGTGGFDAMKDFRVQVVLNRGSDAEIRSGKQELFTYLTSPFGVDFRSRDNTAEHSRNPKSVDLGAALIAEKTVLTGMIARGLAAAASCGVPLGQVAILEQGSGACFWRAGFATNPVGTCAAFHPAISDHDYEVVIPLAASAGTACLVDKLNDAGDIDKLGDVSFFAVPREEFVAATLNINAPAGGGADTTGDLGLGRQSLLLKWALEGEYVTGVAGLAAPPISLDALLTKLRTTPIIADEPTGVPRLEGFEWATLQRYNFYKSGAHVRITGAAADSKSYLYELQQEDLHHVAKAGLRAAMGRLIADPDGNRMLFIDRTLYHSPAGCLTGTENPAAPRLPGALFAKPCDSFEEHIASTAVRSFRDGLTIFTLAEVQLIHRFYLIKTDAACAVANCQTQITDQTKANTFLSAALAFIETAGTVTKPVYDLIIASGKDSRAAQRVANTSAAQAKSVVVAADVTRTLMQRVVNATDAEFPGVPLRMFAGGALPPSAPTVPHVLNLVRPVSETIVDVVRDPSGKPILDTDGRPQRIFRPKLPAAAPQVVAVQLDPDNRLRECDKQDNVTGFQTYPLDPSNPAPPPTTPITTPWPLPAAPAPCTTTPRPALKVEKFVNGQPHIKVAQYTPVKITQTVTNTGTTTLQGVTVVELLTNTTFGPVTLAPGQKSAVFTATYTPAKLGKEIVAPSEAIGFDPTGEGMAAGWDSVAIDVVGAPCALAVVPLEFDPNPYVNEAPVSEVMQGGTAIRHYVVRGSAIPGSQVNYTVDGLPRLAMINGNGRIFHAKPDGTSEFGLPVDTTTLAGPGTYEVKILSVSGSTSVCSEPFYVEVTPREYTRGYSAGASIDAAAVVGLGISGKAGTGLSFSLDERASGERTKLSLERSISATLGVEASASTPKARFMIPGVRGQVGATAGLTASGTLSLSDTHQFDYPPGGSHLAAKESVAFGGLLLAVLVKAAGPQLPLLDAVLEAVANSDYESFKTTDSASLGLEVGGSAGFGAIVGLGLSDKSRSKVFSTMKYGLGVGGSVGAAVSATISGDLNYKDWEMSPGFALKGNADLGGFMGAGNVQVGLSSDKTQKVLKLQDRFKATLKGSIAGSFKAKLALDAIRNYEIKRLTVSITSSKDFGWQALGSGAASSSTGAKETISYTFSDRASMLKVIDKLDAIEQLGRVADIGLSTATGGVVLGAAEMGKELLELWHLLLEADATYEASTELGDGVSLPFELELGFGVRFKIGAAVNLDRSIGEVTERGTVKNGEQFVLERYQHDAFIAPMPATSDLSDIAALVQEGFSGVVAAISATGGAAGPPVDVVAKPTVPGPNSIRSNRTAQLDFDGSTASFPEIAIATYTYTPIAGPVAAVVQYPADVTGPAGLPHFGIGGFHQFSPADVVLSAPATLRIEYKDAEVAGIDESALAIYIWNATNENWEYVGGIVDAAANTITTETRRLGLYTAAPPMPASRFTFSSATAPAGTPEEPKTRVTYTSGTIRTNTGQVVADGTFFTVRALQAGTSDALPLGEILTIDADPSAEGVQVAAVNGVVRFVAEHPGAIGAARMLVNSTIGVAVATQIIPYQ